MPWIKDFCVDAVCGTTVGLINSVFGTSYYDETDWKEISSLKKLTISVMEKSPKLVTEPVICEAIKNGQQTGLDNFLKNVPPEVATGGVVAAAEVVCRKAFQQRFKNILMGACLNLVGC